MQHDHVSVRCSQEAEQQNWTNHYRVKFVVQVLDLVVLVVTLPIRLWNRTVREQARYTAVILLHCI